MTGAEMIEFPTPELSVSALRWGSPSGRLALCLHGFPDTPHTWRHLGPALADRGFHVVAPYLRGYAPTSLPADDAYHVGALMHDALAVHERFGSDDAVVIGHDWGATVSNALAAHADSPFAAAVSMAVPPVPAATRTRTTSLARQLPHSWYMAFAQLPGVSEAALTRLIPKLWRDWSPGYDASADVPRVLDALSDHANRRAALRFYRAQLTRPPARYRTLHAAWFRPPRVRTLYLHGADDGCIRPALAGRVHDVLPVGSDVEIVPGAGHFLHLERPDEVNSVITGFLERH